MSLFQRKAAGYKETDEEEDVNILKEIVSLILYIAIVVVLIFVINTYIGERTVVEGDSMNDTLTNGDSLWISKLSYRLSDPKRYDIIVFPYQDTDEYYVKRIIGLPGETIRIDVDGNIYIDQGDGDVLLDDDIYGKEAIKDPGRAIDAITLGEDEYFVLGDNRNDSKDSRDPSVGNIKGATIEGKVVFRLWPLSGFGALKHQE